MNMKKTIAALAAGAVAVSAMATTVSALADTTLTYNLVKKYEVKAPSANTATYEFTVSGAAAQIADVNFTSTKDDIKSVVVKVASSTAGEQNKIFTYSTDANALNYNKLLDTTTGTLTFQDELKGYTAEVVITVTVNTETDNDAIAKINTDIDNTVIKTTTAGATPITLKAFTKGDGNKKDEYLAPFKTEIKNNANITAYLEAGDRDLGNNVTAKSQGYYNVGAVLNDAIENYETVTFTFNTATNGIVWTTNGAVNAWDNAGNQEVDVFGKKVFGRAGDGWADAGRYEEAYVRVGGDLSKLTAIYSGEWYADNSYKSFDQHLYQGTNNVYGIYGTSYASENTGYLGFDWTGYNLFQGALVINENLTMSLAETDYFDWTATSLSFDWDAIMDGAMTSNDYAVYLHSMKLATSNTWYWDNMTVTLTAGAADDVEAEAGVEADDEELAEEEVEEEVVEEVEEEEVEVEVEVANPTTGNASVALAVIPVALAAAAVVAKKRS